MYAELEHHIRAVVRRYRAEKENARTLSILESTMQSTADGILVVDGKGKIVRFNLKFKEIWGFPEAIVESKNIDTAFAFVLDRLKEPEGFIKKVRDLYDAPEKISFDVLELKNGRVFERYSQPLWIEGSVSGRVWSFRDVTERKRAEDAIRESEARYKNISETTTDFVFSCVKPEGDTYSIDWIAGAVEGILGYTVDEMHTMRCWKCLVHPDDISIFDKNISYLPVGTSSTCKLRIRTKSGTERWLAVNTTNVPTNGLSSFNHVFGGCKDITEQMSAEDALRKSEEKFRLISESSPDHIMIQDHDLRYEWFLNPIFGMTFTDMIGKTDYDLLNKEDADKLTSLKREVMRSGNDLELTTSLLAPDGRREYFKGTYVPRHDANGHNNGIMGYFRNVTEATRAQESLYEANRKLNLLSSITRHDINNQLMALMGYLALLEDKQSDAGSDEHLMKAEAAADRISAMIHFTKTYEDMGVNAPIWQDVRTLIGTSSEDVPLEKMRVVNDVPAGTEVFADPMIAKVFRNLVHNALQHGRCTTIRFSLEEQDGIRFIVGEDDGVGISSEIREKLFTKGYGKNHGFGLFLSREILSITGITITVESKLGHGARFVMTVPTDGLRNPKTK